MNPYRDNFVAPVKPTDAPVAVSEPPDAHFNHKRFSHNELVLDAESTAKYLSGDAAVHIKSWAQRLADGIRKSVTVYAVGEGTALRGNALFTVASQKMLAAHPGKIAGFPFVAPTQPRSR